MPARKKATFKAPAHSKHRRTQEERRATSEQLILDAAMRLIARKGIVRLTLADVGAEAGYSRGLPAHLFGNKEGLLISVVDRFISGMQMESVLPEWVPGQGLEILGASLRGWSEYAVRNPIVFRTYHVLIGEATCQEVEDTGTDLRERVRTINGQMRKHIQQMLERGKAAGDIAADVDPFQTALQIISTTRGLLSIWLLDPKEFDLVAATRRYVQDLSSRLRARPSTKKRT